MLRKIFQTKKASMNGKAFEKEMSFLEHISELRLYIIISCAALAIGFILALFLYEPAVDFLSKPFLSLQSSQSKDILYITGILEGFFVKMKISFLLSLILTFPLHLFLVLKFLFPALTYKEKSFMSYILIASFFLVIVSLYYSYGKILPLSISFLTSAGFLPENIGVLLNFEKNIFFIFQFIFVALIMFQVPLVLFVLMMLGIIKRKRLWQSSRFVLVGIVVVSALLTPPDPLSLISIALPLALLYFLMLFLAKIFRFGE